MRVLLLAYECNPDWPSLPAVAYKYTCALSDYVDITLVTHSENRLNIEREGIGKAKVIYIDMDWISVPLESLGRVLRGGSNVGWTIRVALTYPSYLAFELAVWKRFKQALRDGEFDLVHRVTPMTPTLPSPMAKLSPVPFLLGPLNGGLPWPKEFAKEQGAEREWLSSLRNAYRLMPYYRSTYSCSTAILAAFDHTIADLPAAVQSKAINFPEVGLDPNLFSPPNRPQHQQMTILFAGRLVPYKLPEVVIRAFAASKTLQQHRLVVVGEGPEKPKLEKIVDEQGLNTCVELVGWKSQAEVGELMRQADILAFPSIRELGAGVVVEAMACGMACVVVDYGGCATLIGADRGIKIELGNFEHLVQRFIEELEQLVSDPDRVAHLGNAAYYHAMAYYPWHVKAKKTVEIYNWLINNQRQERPDFWQPLQPSLQPSE